ncbi:MAG TPA: hypothetical protein VGR73_10230 [Bryobacteraceae bacterium]|nr:hypothetical protein [Bryobacteraceae bacterium]
MRLRGFVLFLLGLLLVFTSLEAQIGYPGRTPYPTGGTYPGGPGGPYPGGSGGGSPGGSRGGRPSEPSRSNRGRKDALPTITTTGMLRLVGGTQFVLEADDHRIITYKTTGSTKVEKSAKTVELKDLDIGDHFTVDATSDDEGFFTAVDVTFNLAGTAADREAAARTWDLPTLTSTPSASASKPAGSGSAPSGAARTGDDDDRPIIRRGKSEADTARNAPAQPASVPASTPANGQSSSGQGANGNTAAAAVKPPEQAPEDAVDTRPTTLVRPSDPAPDADDPGKPALRRGRPVARPRPVPVEPETVAGATPAPGASSPGNSPAAEPAAPSVADSPPAIGFEDDPVIRKAKDAAQEYASALPDFFCRQVTTRYQTDGPKNGWQAVDIVTADLSYQDGRETYKNIKIGSKPVNTDMGDIPGTRSTGEFASILEDLFAPDTAATFRKSGQSRIRGRSTDTYKFEVKRENSHWRIVTAAQLYYPAIRGTVWIDRETARVLRIEMEGRNMPLLFPFDKVESATDYDFVRLSSPQQFLMPVNAEVLSCEQGSSTCLRNRIEFRNYRKFGADSDITFDN